MVYEFKFTEQNVERGSEFETKTLLYLLGIDPESSEINFIFIDCFNDVTGSDEHCEALWDFQSKGVKNLTPRQIGKSLITLFENYNCELKFRKYALFIPIPNQRYILNSSLNEFGIKNFDKYRKEIREGVKAEYIRRNESINFGSDEDKRIDSFLDIVKFVVDCIKKQDYVKNLISFKDKDLKPSEFYIAIFDEIRAVQSSKKAISIHKCTINCISDALSFKKHLHTHDITTLLINRLIGVDLFNRKSIPIEFKSEVDGLEKNEIRDLIQDCNIRISRAVFDKNSKNDFWNFLEKSITQHIAYPELSSREIYNIVCSNGQKKYRHLSELSGIYLISVIMEGLEQ